MNTGRAWIRIQWAMVSYLSHHSAALDSRPQATLVSPGKEGDYMRKLLFLLVLAALAHTAPQACRAEAPPAHGLEFHEFVTGGASAEEELPLIIAVHGLGDSPKKFAGLLSGFKQPARIVCPQGPTPHGRGYSWFDTRISKGRVTSIDLAEIEEASDRLALLISTLSKSRPTKGKAVITGFSQGGVLSFVVAFRHPDVISVAVPVGGLLPEEIKQPPVEQQGPGPVVRALHGEDDKLVDFARAKESVARMKRLGMDAELKSFPGVAHRIPPAVRKALYDLLKRAVRGEPLSLWPHSPSVLNPMRFGAGPVGVIS